MTASPIQLLMHAIPVFTAVTIVPATPGLSEKYDCRILVPGDVTLKRNPATIAASVMTQQIRFCRRFFTAANIPNPTISSIPINAVT